MKYPNLIYCFDPYCTWCYGFRPVIHQIADAYKNELKFEVLSGGMVLPDYPEPFSYMACGIKQEYKRVEEYSGVKFGEAYLNTVFHPEENEIFPNSLKAAIALSIIKDLQPESALDFAGDLQLAVNLKGLDITKDEAYSELAQKYGFGVKEFIEYLHTEKYNDLAIYDFHLVQQLGVDSFPCVLIQEGDLQFYLAAKGFTDFETLKTRITNILKEISLKQNGK